jgi:hypothetical protein
MGTPLHMSLGSLLSQLDVSTVPLTSKCSPNPSSKAFALSLTSVYAPTPGSGHEKKPKSGVSTVNQQSMNEWKYQALARDEVDPPFGPRQNVLDPLHLHL